MPAVKHACRVLLAAIFVLCLVSCDRPARLQLDPELPDPGGLSYRLRGEDDAPDLPVDNLITLTFDTDERFFYGVVDAALLPGNAVAIASEQSGEILLFDSAGAFVRAIGRPGSGPGEFQNLRNIVWVGGDTIAAFDSRARIISFFDTTGRFLEGHRIDTPPEATLYGAAALAGSIDRRRFLILSYVEPTEELLMNLKPNQVVQVPLLAFISDLVNGSSLVIGIFPGDDQWGSDISGTETSYGLAPFGRRTWFGTRNGRIVAMRSTEPGFRVHLADGSPHAVYQGAMRTRKVTDEDREEFLANWGSSLHEEPYWNRMKSLLEEKGFPDTLPFFRDAIVGNDGIVWLEPYESWHRGTREYVGFDSAGVAVGRLRFPHNGRLLDIGNGVAVVHRFVEFGTEAVTVHRFGSNP